MRIKYFIALVWAFIPLSSFSQSIDDLYNVGRALNAKKTEVVKDTVEVQFVTNIPANLKLNGIDYGEVSSKPYHLKYGQYKVEITAEGCRTKTKTIEPSRTQQNIYSFKLKEDNSVPFRKGIQQEIGLTLGASYTWSGLVDYIIGYRFNNWVFLGAGTGLYLYNHFSSSIDKDSWKTNEDYIPFRYHTWREFEYIGHNRPSFEWLQNKTISVEVPLFAHLKVYFTDTRWKPFFLTSLGGRFGLNKDKDFGVFFNLGLGVEYRLTEKYSLNMSLGYKMEGMKFFEVDRQVDYLYCGTANNKCYSACPYYYDLHYHFSVSNYEYEYHSLAHSIFLHLGFVF